MKYWYVLNPVIFSKNRSYIDRETSKRNLIKGTILISANRFKPEDDRAETSNNKVSWLRRRQVEPRALITYYLCRQNRPQLSARIVSRLKNPVDIVI